MSASTLATHNKPFPLETNCRLSQSVLWQLQRNYFERQGIEAWNSGAVPHHITSSPFITDAYARIVFGFLRDCAAVSRQDNSSVAKPADSRPLYIVELGSGSGRFAYLFLRKLLDLYRSSVLKNFQIKYVMTDLAERNLEYWRTHSWLQSLVEEGLLDFARFDVEHDQKLKLIHSEALAFLQRSVDLHGIAPGTAYNAAVCYYGLGQMDQALDYVEQALNLDHQFAEAATLRTELESALLSTTSEL